MSKKAVNPKLKSPILVKKGLLKSRHLVYHSALLLRVDAKKSPQNQIITEIAMKTYSAKANEIKHDWYVVDATDQPLGRLASEIAKRLRGKHKPQFTPHTDVGDHIIVINAAKIAVSGNKLKDKIYHRHSGYIGSLKSQPLEKLLKEHPERVIEKAIKGMLPRNPLGRAMFRKLRVYADGEHQHAAQQPQELRI